MITIALCAVATVAARSATVLMSFTLTLTNPHRKLRIDLRSQGNEVSFFRDKTKSVRNQTKQSEKRLIG